MANQSIYAAFERMWLHFINKLQTSISEINIRVNEVEENLASLSTEANKISYDNTSSGLIATNVQSAIDEAIQKVGTLQVAELTVVSENSADVGQTVTIANSMYSISAVFDEALSITFPIYTWGDYIVNVNANDSSISITEEKYSYELYTGAYNFVSQFLAGNQSWAHIHNNSGSGSSDYSTNGYFQCTSSAKSNSWSTGYFTIPVDLTNYSTITINGYGYGFAYCFGFQKTPTMSSGGGGQQAYGYTTPVHQNGALGGGSYGPTTFTIDVSTLTGEYYLACTTAGSSDGYGGDVRIYSAILEK